MWLIQRLTPKLSTLTLYLGQHLERVTLLSGSHFHAGAQQTCGKEASCGRDLAYAMESAATAMRFCLRTEQHMTSRTCRKLSPLRILPARCVPLLLHHTGQPVQCPQCMFGRPWAMCMHSWSGHSYPRGAPISSLCFATMACMQLPHTTRIETFVRILGHRWPWQTMLPEVCLSCSPTNSYLQLALCTLLPSSCAHCCIWFCMRFLA
jgi:hypothetical protein